MKLLVPYIDADGRPLSSPIVTGGIERFIKDLVECVPGVIPVEIVKGTSPKDITKAVVDAARSNDVDAVLCNYPQASLSTNVQKQLQVPVIWAVHHTAGFMSSLGAVGRISEFSKTNHVWFVSRYQEKRWQELAARMKAAPIRVSGYIAPSVIRERYSVVPSDLCVYDVCTVGRCEKKPDKDPFLCHYRLRDTGLRTLVMTNKKDNDYFRENQHWRDNHYTNYDLPHDQVMANISRSMVYFVTWPDETFGITALEALSRGVPVVCNAKMDHELGRWSHAAEEIPVKDYHMAMASTKKLDSTVIAVKKYLENPQKDHLRLEIADLTYERFNVDSWRKSIYNNADHAIEDFKKSAGNSAAASAMMELFE